MKLTKGQKIWIGLLGIGLGALVVDQTNGHGQAAAAEVGESIVAPAASGAVLAARSESGMPNVHQQLAERLSTLARTADPFVAVRDAFRPSANADVLGDSPAAGGPGPSVGSFIASHTLKAVFRNGGRQQAWVNERIIEVGQMIDGARLVAAEGMAARFELNGQTVELVLPDAAIASLEKPYGKPAGSH